MRIRIAVVEDEKESFEYVSRCLKDWGKQNGQLLHLTHVSCAEEFLFEYNRPDCFDLLFLDVYMKQMNGMELAKEIRKFDKDIPIIFLTGVSDYVFEGYEIGAIRYLLKPVQKEKLAEVMDLCLEKFKNRNDDYISFKYQGEQMRLLRSDIMFLEVNGHYLRMETVKETFEWKDSLQSMKERLDGKRFVSANRSAIVNLEYVSKITRDECLLENGTKIQVSKGAYRTLNEAFMAYYVG